MNKDFLSFVDFQDEVRSLYPDQAPISRWYHEERKNHKNWPSSPNIKYKDDWQGWPELVGKENRLKKDFAPFEDFKEEVLAAYSGATDVQKWYKKERRQHWPSNPNLVYKDDWQSWPELFDRENHKRSFLSFDDFSDEVRRLYPGIGGGYSWFVEEQKGHKDWPANPAGTYKEKGWNGWSELLGKEKHVNKDFLLFADFLAEVQSLYTGRVDVKNWYHEERKNHKDWPYEPEVKYKDAGWAGYAKLVVKK